MILFKCLSKNNDETEKSKRSRKLKKHKPETTNEEVTVTRKSRGLSVRFTFEGNKQYSYNESLLEDSIRVHVDGSTNGYKHVRSVVQNKYCCMDSNFTQRVYNNPVFVNDLLDEPIRGHLPSCIFHPPFDWSIISPMEKVQLYLSSIANVSFDDIGDTDSKLVDSTVTPQNTKLSVKLIKTKGRHFHDRFPHVPENDGTIICRQSSTPVSNQSKLSFNCSTIINMKRLVDYSLYSSVASEGSISDETTKQVNRVIDDSLCGPLHSTLQEPSGDSNPGFIDYFNLNGREMGSSDDYDEDEADNKSCSLRGSPCLDSLILEPERLFQDANDSQSVEENIDRKDSKIRITIFRDDNGFGFSVGGERPPIVTRVLKDSPADKAGIRKGDEVLTVNTRRMHEKTCEHIGRFIRVIDPKYLILELRRDYQDIELRKNARDGLPEDSFLDEARSDGNSCSDEGTSLADQSFSTVSDKDKLLKTQTTKVIHLYKNGSTMTL